MNPQPKTATLAALPPKYPAADDLRAQIRARVDASRRALVVLDDDPTGTQTVHDVPVLTTWSVDALAAELSGEDNVFYVLTNSRSLTAADAAALNREIGRNLTAAAARTGRAVAVVSRSDSTLRGHFPGEVTALAEGLGQSFDGRIIVPFFLEGGRYTINDVHWVAEGDQLIPAAQTPYARDAAFGYTQSNLKEWVAEKSGGAIAAEDVASISIEDLRVGGPAAVTAKLMALHDEQPCVVNAASYRDLEIFVLGLLAAEDAGKRFLYRTAASFVQVRAGISARPLLTAADLGVAQGSGALFVVGSYVPKTTAQLNALLSRTDITALEVDVDSLLADRAGTVQSIVAAANASLREDGVTVVYTSRKYVGAAGGESDLSIGAQVSAGLIDIVRGVDVRPRYLVAKGGITSSDVATRGLDVRSAVVAGQILPGVPVWRIGEESRFPGLAYIVFPGNVGGDDALVQVVEGLENSVH
ncbi:MAG: four-carbon acid sugar kinase family protein [Caldilineaceae bacterium]